MLQKGISALRHAQPAITPEDRRWIRAKLNAEIARIVERQAELREQIDQIVSDLVHDAVFRPPDVDAFIEANAVTTVDL